MLNAQLPKLLFLTDWFAPGYKAGGPIRSTVNVVVHLQAFFQIYVLTTDRDLQAIDAYPGIETDQWILYQEHTQVCYLSPEQLQYATIKEKIEEVMPDIIYLNSMFSKVFTIFPLWWARAEAYRGKMVLAPRGMLRPSALQFKSLKKKLFLKLLYWSGFPKRICFQATDDHERKDIQRHFGLDTNIRVLGNLPAQVPDYQLRTKQKTRLLFIGRIHPIKGLKLVLDCLKQVRSDIHLSIVGPLEDQDYWKNCQEVIDQLGGHIKVDALGAIPHHQLQPIFADHHFFILPTQGENFGHAIFEAFSAGLPVIISDQTPWRNLKDQKIGWDISLDQPEAFVNAIETAAAMDQETYDLWSKSAWEYARLYVEGSDLLERYQELFRVD